MNDTKKRNFITANKQKWYSQEYIERNFIKRAEVKKYIANNFISKDHLYAKYLLKKNVIRKIKEHRTQHLENLQLTDKVAEREKLRERIDEDKKILEEFGG